MLTLPHFIGRLTPADVERIGPVIRDGDCKWVCLPDGSLEPCNGLTDGERKMVDWWQRQGGEKCQ